MKRISFVGLLLFSCFLITSCNDDDDDGDDEVLVVNGETSTSPSYVWPNFDTDDWAGYQWTDSETVPTTGDEADDYYENTNFVNDSALVVFNGGTASVTGADSYIQTQINGAHVTITCTGKVKFIVSGTTTNGSLKFYSDSKFMVRLNGANITNHSGSAFNNQSGKRTFIDVCDGTTNTLTDAVSYSGIPDDEDCKACLFSEAQLIFSGKGSLSITASYKHGICSDEYVLIRPYTNISIGANASKGDGIHANEYVTINGGSLSISSVKDGIDAEGVEDELGNVSEGNIHINGGNVDITTTGEKGHALKAEGNLEFNAGNVEVKTSGAAARGMNVSGNITFLGGKYSASIGGTGVYDDDENDVSSAAGIKCDGNVEVTNTGIYLAASGKGGKGINADGTITINSGRIEVSTSGSQYVYQNLDTSPKGIKADGIITINGGTAIIKAVGGDGAEGLESKDKIYIAGGAVSVESYDDAVNAKNLIQVSDGFLLAHSTNNDAIDSGTDDSGSQGLLTITGGFVYAIGASQPEAGFDCDQHTFTITGGTLFGLGGSSSTPTSSACTQNSFLYGASNLSGKKVCLYSSSDSCLFVVQVPQYSSLSSSATLLFSSPKLEQGTTYAIFSGGTIVSGTELNGYYSGATYSGGSLLVSFTQNSRVTTVGNFSNNPPH